MESLKRALESIGRMWSALTAVQRVVLGAAAALMVVLLVVTSVGTSQAWVRVAGAEANISDIQKKLRERNQKFEVRGSEIYVPKEDADHVMVELAGEGTVNNNAVFEFLKQSDIFATRWQQEKRLQIALQTKLESMIRSIESVKNAAVVINPGSANHQLGFAGPKASASVQVELKEGMELSSKNVRAIAGLVARAVSGVEEDQVHIMDTKGKPYRVTKSDPNGLSWDIWESARNREKEIQERISKLLEFPGATVVVNIEPETRSTTSESVTHDKPIVIDSTEHKRSIRKGSGSPTSVRKGEGDPAIETAPGNDETESTTTEKSVVGLKKVMQTVPAGAVLRTTVAVRIPVEEGAPLAEARRQLQELREQVRIAAGTNVRAEDVSVQVFPTKRPEPITIAKESGTAWLWLWANWPKILLGLMAIGAVWIVIRVIQRAGAQDTVEELQALTSALTETREAAAELAGPGESDLARVKQGLQDMVGRNPQNVAASLKSFMSGR